MIMINAITFTGFV